MVQRYHTLQVLTEIVGERIAQDGKWGEQNHPDLSPRLFPRTPGFDTLDDGAEGQFDRGSIAWLAAVARYYGVPIADRAKEYCQSEHEGNYGSWFSIHVEELAEALEQAALGDTAKMRAELIQLAATCTAHVEAIDRRTT